MKKLLLYFFLTMVFISFVGYYTKNGVLPFTSKKSTEESSEKFVLVGDQKIIVEVADTPEKRELGLSFRDSLDEGRGMLFVFESKDRVRKFWMKDMKFPIDIIWIYEEKIVNITKNIPIPEKGIADENLPTYSSERSIDYVLEVPAGYCDKKGIELGDSVEISI